MSQGGAVARRATLPPCAAHTPRTPMLRSRKRVVTWSPKLEGDRKPWPQRAKARPAQCPSAPFSEERLRPALSTTKKMASNPTLSTPLSPLRFGGSLARAAVPPWDNVRSQGRWTRTLLCALMLPRHWVPGARLEAKFVHHNLLCGARTRENPWLDAP